MFYLFITFALLIIFIIIVKQAKHPRYNNPYKNNSGWIVLGVLFGGGILLYHGFAIYHIVKNIHRYNTLITEIVYMKPVSINVAKYNNAKRELSKTEALINKVVDKYQIQVKVENLNGVSIYSTPLSQNVASFNGLGDIERGSGEKLKNLETLIDKQNILAHELLEIQNSQYKEEYYIKLQQLNALRYNLFCGWIIRWFGLNPQKDLVLIVNKEIYSVGSVLNAK